MILFTLIKALLNHYSNKNFTNYILHSINPSKPQFENVITY